MNKLVLIAVTLAVTASCFARFAIAQPVDESPPAVTSAAFVLGPPKDDGPVVVRASFEFHDIDEISEEAETFEFTGILTLRWRDERQAFDPAEVGVGEKIYQGDYQFNELSPSWFPQVVLVNSSGSVEQDGVVLRVLPDGTQTLMAKLTAVAKTEFNLRRYPFDKQRLEAVFEVLGFDDSEVLLEVETQAPSSAGRLWVPQWTIDGISTSIRNHSASHAGGRDVVSVFVTSIDVRRQSFYVSRLVTLPLIVIVLLSFSVFWMDRASLGDRIAVSFIGILTAVAYQVVMNDILPRIAYVTWMHGFLNFSFLMMVGTVIINLVVGAFDQQGKPEIGDLIDRRCRWIFPGAYFSLILFAFGVAFLLF